MQWQFLCHAIQHALSHEQNWQEHVHASGHETGRSRKGLQYFIKGRQQVTDCWKNFSGFQSDPANISVSFAEDGLVFRLAGSNPNILGQVPLLYIICRDVQKVNEAGSLIPVVASGPWLQVLKLRLPRILVLMSHQGRESTDPQCSGSPLQMVRVSRTVLILQYLIIIGCPINWKKACMVTGQNTTDTSYFRANSLCRQENKIQYENS